MGRLAGGVEAVLRFTWPNSRIVACRYAHRCPNIRTQIPDPKIMQVPNLQSHTSRTCNLGTCVSVFSIEPYRPNIHIFYPGIPKLGSGSANRLRMGYSLTRNIQTEKTTIFRHFCHGRTNTGARPLNGKLNSK